MSKEFDTDMVGVTPPPPEMSVGVTRPPPESCDERGKRLKLEQESSESGSESESEVELESDSEPEPEPKWDWRTIPYKDLVYEDFSSRFDDDPTPYVFGCQRFMYKNKAQIKKDEAQAKALAEYYQLSANISPYDAIPIPPLAITNLCGNNFPRPITIDDMSKDLCSVLIELCKLALINYNDGNQGSQYEFHKLVKAVKCRFPRTTYYLTFEAKDATHVTTFQAHVWNRYAQDGPPVVESCSIKT